MKKAAIYTVIVLLAGFGVSGWCAPTAQPESPLQVKSDSLKYLQDLRTENVKRLKDIDATLSRKVEETQSDNFESTVQALRAQKREHILRQEFLDRLIFQIDTKFAGQDLRGFIKAALEEMTKIDVMSQSDSGLSKFMKFALEAVRSLPEQKENILAFLEGYMNRSVANPISPKEYLNSRNYSNGSKSESGKPMPRDQVGAIADRRLQEMVTPQKPTQSKVEQRIR